MPTQYYEVVGQRTDWHWHTLALAYTQNLWLKTLDPNVPDVQPNASENPVIASHRGAKLCPLAA